MDMGKNFLFCLTLGVILILLSVPAYAGSDPNIERFYAIPDEPYTHTHFQIYVRAEDNDGIDKIKLYDGSSLEDTHYCDGRRTCSAYFRLYETKSGSHSYRAKVYDEEGDTESETLRVYIKSGGYSYPYPYPDDVPRFTNYYPIPSNPQTGQTIQFYVSAYDNDGMGRLEIWHGGSRIGMHYCYGVTTCSRTFSVSSKYSPGSYTYTFKAYDDRGRSSSVSRTVYVQSGYVPPSPPYNALPVISSSTFSPSQPREGQSFQVYVRATDDQGLSRIEVREGSIIRGTKSCNNARDCSVTITISGKSAGSYSFTLKAIDNSGQTTTTNRGVVVSPSVVVYTCGQLGGFCCPYGGTGTIGGSSDCPNSCFASCTQPPQPPSDQTSPPTTPPSQPSGPMPYIVLAGDSGTFWLFVASVIILLLVIGMGWSVLRR